MTPADIRKLADMDYDWLPRKYAEVLRACADVVEAAKLNTQTIFTSTSLHNALAELDAIAP